MSDPETLPPPVADKVTRARHLDVVARALLATPCTRAFESGQAFNEIANDQLHLALGFSSFEDYMASLESEGFKRATIYSNMRLAEKFDRERHGHVGVGRLRLLAAEYVTNPIKLIEEGIDVPDGKGGTKRRTVKEMTCRNLGYVLRKLYPPQPKPRKRAVVTTVPDPMAERTEAAVAPLLTGTLNAKGSVPPADIEAPPSQPVVPSPRSAVAVGTVDLDGPFIDEDEDAYATATLAKPVSMPAADKRGGMARARSA